MAEREANDGGLAALLLGVATHAGEDPGPGDPGPAPRGRRWLVVVPIAAGAVLGVARGRAELAERRRSAGPNPAPEPPAGRIPPGQIDNPGNGSPPGQAKKWPTDRGDDPRVVRAR